MEKDDETSEPGNTGARTGYGWPIRRPNRFQWLGIRLILIVLFIINFTLLFNQTSDWQVWTLAYWGESRAEVFMNFGLVLVAVFAVRLAGKWMAQTRKLAELDTSANEIDRFQRGVRMLEGETLAVRLGGIATVREIALANPQRWFVEALDCLYAFVREGSKEDFRRALEMFPESETDRDIKGAEKLATLGLRADFKSALLAATRIRTDCENTVDVAVLEEWAPDLSGVRLCGAVLDGINLANADLSHAVFHKAEFLDTNLASAHMMNITMRDCVFHDCDFTKAGFGSADLTGTVFCTSDFSRVYFGFTNVSGAGFENCFFDEEGLTLGARNLPKVWADAGASPFEMPDAIRQALVFRPNGLSLEEFKEPFIRAGREKAAARAAAKVAARV